MEVELTCDGSELALGSEAIATVVALALAGMLSTIARFSRPPWNAETLKAVRSVICAGAVQTVFELVGERPPVGDEEGKTVTMAVIVEGATEMVTVLGAAVTVVTSVIISRFVRVELSGKGMISEENWDTKGKREGEGGSSEGTGHCELGGGINKSNERGEVHVGSAVANCVAVSKTYITDVTVTQVIPEAGLVELFGESSGTDDTCRARSAEIKNMAAKAIPKVTETEMRGQDEKSR
jgi:hypothetical protein